VDCPDHFGLLCGFQFGPQRLETKSRGEDKFGAMCSTVRADEIDHRINESEAVLSRTEGASSKPVFECGAPIRFQEGKSLDGSYEKYMGSPPVFL
jgi:hypothetical protein